MLSKMKQTGINSTDIQGVPISWKSRTGKVYCRTGCCQNYSQNIGHAVEIVSLEKYRAFEFLTGNDTQRSGIRMNSRCGSRGGFELS